MIESKKQLMGQPITRYRHFAMVEMLALEQLQGLMREAPKAAELAVLLIRQLKSGGRGVVVASRETLREMLGCSMPTVDRALKVLIGQGWVQRIKIGGAYALVINHRIAWVGDRGEISRAVFDATVIASRAEQDAVALEPPPMRQFPILQADEDVIPTGEGLPPPSQPNIPGLEPAISTDPSLPNW
jgi:DNA-binding transcriptional MocR family regulator